VGAEEGWRLKKAGGWRLAAEGGRLAAEGGRRKAGGGRRKAEGGRRKAEGGRRKAEGGRRKAEGGRRKAEVPFLTSAIRLYPFPPFVTIRDSGFSTTCLRQHNSKRAEFMREVELPSGVAEIPGLHSSSSYQS